MQTDPSLFFEGKEEGYSGRTIIEQALGRPSQEEATIPERAVGGEVGKNDSPPESPGKGDIPLTVMDIQGDDVIVLMGTSLDTTSPSNIEIIEVVHQPRRHRRTAAPVWRLR